MECWSNPLQWLCEVAGYWQELEYAVVYVNPEHPKHAQWQTRCLPSALYSENRDSSVKRTPLQSARCHRMWAFAHSSRLRWRSMRTMSMQISFPETVSDSLCRNYLVMQTDCCSSCPGGWSQTILEVKMYVEVLGWCGYPWSAVVRQVWCTAKFSETPLDSLWGSGLVSLLASQAYQHYGHLTNVWCFWQCEQVPNPKKWNQHL